MWKLICYIEPETRVHRQGDTFTDALRNTSDRLRHLAGKIMAEEWQKGQLIRRIDITAQVKAGLVNS